MSESGKPALLKKILGEIEKSGRISFARFMEIALYDPEEGYYTCARDPIGRSGDYDTSPEVHAIFGDLIAGQLISLFYSLGEEAPPTLLEMGAGKGLLARDIWNGIRKRDAALFERLRGIIVERSPSMVSRQKAMLAGDGLDKKIRWHSDLHQAQAEGGLVGCLLSNELVDAFPVHRVVMTEEGLEEIYVTARDGKLEETIGEPSAPDLVSYFDRLKIRLVPGQLAEVNLEAVRWMREVTKTLQKGYVITIDYGHTAADLYNPHHLKGTLLCYYRHTVTENPYIRIGEQDITVHVDFTTLARVGREAGLEVTGFTDQEHFLLGLGIAQAMEGLDPKSPAFLAMRRLIDHSIMGRTFKILIQHKNVTPPPLVGLTFKPFFTNALWR